MTNRKTTCQSQQICNDVPLPGQHLNQRFFNDWCEVMLAYTVLELVVNYLVAIVTCMVYMCMKATIMTYFYILVFNYDQWQSVSACGCETIEEAYTDLLAYRYFK